MAAGPLAGPAPEVAAAHPAPADTFGNGASEKSTHWQHALALSCEMRDPKVEPNVISYMHSWERRVRE